MHFEKRVEDATFQHKESHCQLEDKIDKINS